MGSFLAFIIIIILLGIIVWLLLRAENIRVPEFVTKKVIFFPGRRHSGWYGDRRGRHDHHGDRR